MADDEQADREREPVVHERRATAPRQWAEVGEEHDQSRDQEHADRAGGQGGVELLAAVELADLDRAVTAGSRPQPGPVA